MPSGRYRRHETAPVGFNATPMVDVIFILTVFFMLVSSFSSAENVPLEVPEPVASQARIAKVPDRVVINCRLADPTDPSGGALYSIGANPPESPAALSKHLAGLKKANPNIKIILRADRRLPYSRVRVVMHAVAANQIDMLNIVAHVGDGG